MDARKPYILILAYLTSALGILFLIISVVAIIVSWVVFFDAIWWKKVLLELVIFISGLVLFFICFGIYSYLRSFVKLEEEVQEVEEEVEKIEQQIK